ncbi:MAG: polysaccharide deacetylase family protein, partial [Actinomycetes bacterium]
TSPSATAPGGTSATPNATVSSTATTPPPASPLGTISVNGVAIPVTTTQTVASALQLAHVTVRAGHLLSASSHRQLPTVVAPATYLVNGAAATLTTVVPLRGVVVAHSGTDRVEPTEQVTLPAALALPAGLYTGGSVGTDLVTRGVVSHDVVTRTPQQPPSPGHLRHPGTVSLTFDDGPDPRWTPQVLALLEEHHVHATFCLIGSKAQQYPQLVKAIVAGGHRLCDHTMDHDEHLAQRPLPQIQKDILEAAHIIQQAGGEAPVYFRAPGGNWSPQLDAVAAQAHLQKLSWSVDTRDWQRPGVPTILATVWHELRPGGIVLLHDGGGPRQQSLDALRQLLDALPAAGYSYRQP